MKFNYNMTDLNKIYINSIRNSLIENNKTYRESGLSKITDQQYDLYLDLLSKYEKKDILDIKVEIEDNIKLSNNLNVNFENKEFSKGGSLEFKKWIKSNNIKLTDNIILSPKLDGISIIFYNNKCFSKRSNKSNLTIDTDLIKHKINVDNLFKLSNELNIAIKCEMVINKNIFEEKYKEVKIIEDSEAEFIENNKLCNCDENDCNDSNNEIINDSNNDSNKYKKYKSHLNYLTSLLTTKNKHKNDFNDVNFIIHSFSEKICNWDKFESGLDKYDLLKYLNNIYYIKLSDFLTKVENLDIDDVLYNNCLINKFNDFSKKSKYEIDGIVFDLNQLEFNPKKYKSIFGYKPAAIGHLITVKDIIWNRKIGNILVPKIVFDNSIFCNGREIKVCSGKNYKFIIENKISIRSILLININAGLIPDISKVIESSNNNIYGIVYNSLKYKFDNNNINIILNEEDNNTIANNIFLFYKKKEIKHLGIKTIEKLTNNGFKTINDIINPNNKDNILNIKSLGIANYNYLISIKDKEFNLCDLLECSPFLLRVNTARLNMFINTGVIYYNEKLFIKELKDNKVNNSSIIVKIRDNLKELNIWLTELLEPNLIKLNL